VGRAAHLFYGSLSLAIHVFFFLPLGVSPTLPGYLTYSPPPFGPTRRAAFYRV